MTRDVRRRPERLVRRHARAARSRSTSRPVSSRSTATSWSRTAACPVNPAIVEGQIRGGVAQAIGAVLLEHAAYGEDGQFLAADVHGLPDADDDGRARTSRSTTSRPSSTDPDVNFRGVGEGGMIVAPACITNAIEDALAPLGVQVREQHLPPSRILELTRGRCR